MDPYFKEFIEKNPTLVEDRLKEAEERKEERKKRKPKAPIPIPNGNPHVLPEDYFFNYKQIEPPKDGQVTFSKPGEIVPFLPAQPQVFKNPEFPESLAEDEQKTKSVYLHELPKRKPNHNGFYVLCSILLIFVILWMYMSFRFPEH